MQNSAQIIRRYRTILSSTGLIFIIVGCLLLLPLLGLAAAPDEYVFINGFIIPAIGIIILGLALWKGYRPVVYTIMTVQEGGVIVLLSWIVTCLVSACPFMLILHLNFTQAVFEAVSGWTTTGLSVVDVKSAPHCILLYRSIIQLAGGAGFAIIMLASLTGPTGVGYSLAEGRSDQLVPHVRTSAKLVIMIYIGYAIVGCIAYLAAGMNLFDSVNHTFAAISTGGFGTRPESIGYWNSVSIEAVSIALMIFGNMNFLTAYLLLTAKFRAFFKNGEIRLFATVAPAGALIIFLAATHGLYPALGKSIRVALFEAVSALTTTGFSTVGYRDWNDAGVLILIVLMIIGGGTCSTAGGIKQYRIYILYRMFIGEIKKAFLPRTAVVQNVVWRGENIDYITDSHVKEVAVYLFIYLSSLFVGTTVIALYGYSFRDALFEFASSLGTVGVSFGGTAPVAPGAVLWVETLGMFLERLEFFVVFVSVGKIFKDI